MNRFVILGVVCELCTHVRFNCQKKYKFDWVNTFLRTFSTRKV
jgi:hypothetical protein